MYGNFLKYFHSLRNYSSYMRAIRWSHIVFWRVTASIWRSITSLPSLTSPGEMLMCYSCMVYSPTQPISSLSAKIELCVSSRNSLQLAWEHFRFLFSIFFSSITRYNFNFRALELIVFSLFSTQHIFSLITASMCGWPTREEVIMAWNTRHSTSIQTTSGISHFTRLECTIWEVDFGRDIRRWSEMNNLSISYLSCMPLLSFHRFRFKWI